MKQKIKDSYIDEGFGFPVILRHVPMIKVFGRWTPDINYKQLERQILLALMRKPSRLTGREIKFIRHYFKLTLEAFGERFDERHTAVLKWKKMKEAPSRMDWSTKKDIRLFILDQLLPEEELAQEIVPLYRAPRKKRNGDQMPVEQDCQQLLAHCG